MGKNFRETLDCQMQDQAFKKEYDALEPEFQIIRALYECRKERHMTQKDLSDATGITQSDISKLERGCANPSLATLKRLANAMEKTVQIKFVPIENSKRNNTQVK